MATVKHWSEHCKGPTVADAIRELSQLDPDMPIGVSGHYGEFLPLSERFVFSKLFDTINQGSGDVQVRPFYAAALTIPNIGEEPD